MVFNWLASIHTFNRKVRKSLAQRGVAATARRFVTKPLQLAHTTLREMSSTHRRCRRDELEFDRRLHVDTAVSADLGWLAQINSDNWVHGIGYAPVPIPHGQSILAGLKIRYEDYTFIDIGAGKGRMLFLASEFPFQRIIGVEYSPDLHQSLERNLATYRNPSQRCFDLCGLLQDATQYELPPQPLVLFFHHPFDETIFRQVIARIERSLDETPRDLRIVYYDPICGPLFEHSGRFQSRQHGERDPHIRYSSAWTVYGTRPLVSNVLNCAARVECR